MNELEKLASLLNVSGSEAWKTMVGMARYEAAGELTVLLLFLVVGIFAVKKGITWLKEDSDDLKGLLMVIFSGILLLVGTVGLLIDSVSLIAVWHNPEYWVLTKLLNSLHH